MARQITIDELVPNLSHGMAAIDAELAAKAPAINFAPLFTERAGGKIETRDGTSFEPAPSNVFPAK